MMNWFDYDDRRLLQLERQLCELGYNDPNLLDMLQTHEDPNDPSVKGYISTSLHISGSYEADIAFSIKEDKDVLCKIGTLYVELYINADNFPEGVAPILRRFTPEDGPLPTKSQITAELSELLKNEEYKEELYLKSTLASEFERLGFLNYNNFLWQPTAGENVGQFSTFQKIGIEEQGVLYKFIIDSNKDHKYPYIKSILVSFYDQAPESDLTPPKYTKQYTVVELPTKAKITWDLVNSIKLFPDQVESVRRRFKIGETVNAESDKPLSQQTRLQLK